jgi:predicted dehydrogenase
MSPPANCTPDLPARMSNSLQGPTTRRTFVKGLAAAGTGIMAVSAARIPGANEQVRVAVLGMGGRGAGHFKSLQGIPGVKVVALCDADTAHLARYKKKDPELRLEQDYRKILEMKDVDAVTIAAPNHWHAAMTVFACQAGKHVYVEKPVSHSIWEGRKMVEAARKYKRIVQGGTQQRSCPAPQEAGRDLREGKYGKVLWVHCMQFNLRGPIGLVTTPQPVPAGVDYNLWAGPAPASPVMRKKFHYDWHWQWNWGDGEMGNWGVHYTDDLCHMLGWKDLPGKVVAGGGRFIWKDNGETPNMHFAYMEHHGLPVVVEIRDLPHSLKRKSAGVYHGARGGNIIMCEKGLIKIARGGGKAYSPDGKETIKSYPGNAGKGHFKNFIQAIRSGKRDDLAAEIEVGHLSSSVAHLANIAIRLGNKATPEDVRQAMGTHEDGVNTVDAVVTQIKANGGSLDPMRLSPVLAFDPSAERFTGDHADEANRFLRPTMRKEFAIPDQV